MFLGLKFLLASLIFLSPSENLFGFFFIFLELCNQKLGVKISEVSVLFGFYLSFNLEKF